MPMSTSLCVYIHVHTAAHMIRVTHTCIRVRARARTRTRSPLHSQALRQIEDLKAKQAQGITLEKTQEGKIVREDELRAELTELMMQADADAAGL